jgi:hypothetical protein
LLQEAVAVVEVLELMLELAVLAVCLAQQQL